MESYFKKLGLILASWFGAGLALIFPGSPFLRVLFLYLGSLLYWVVGLVGFGLVFGLWWASSHSTAEAIDAGAQAGSWILVSLFSASWLGVGVYSEAEKRGLAGFWTFTLSVFVSTLISVLGIYYNLEHIKVALASLIDVEKDFVQLPGHLGQLWMIWLGIGIAMDRTVAGLFGIGLNQPARRLRLSEFKVPDWWIWPLLVSLVMYLIAGLPEWAKPVGFNSLVFLGAFYAIQGFSVVHVSVGVMNFDLWARFGIYILCFLAGDLLGVLGLLEFWLGLRDKLLRWNRNRHREKPWSADE